MQPLWAAIPDVANIDFGNRDNQLEWQATATMSRLTRATGPGSISVRAPSRQMPGPQISALLLSSILLQNDIP
jgi:hypothetical protein